MMRIGSICWVERFFSGSGWFSLLFGVSRYEWIKLDDLDRCLFRFLYCLISFFEVISILSGRIVIYLLLFCFMFVWILLMWCVGVCIFFRMVVDYGV